LEWIINVTGRDKLGENSICEREIGIGEWANDMNCFLYQTRRMMNRRMPSSGIYKPWSYLTGIT
jgi:hypothetical protein